MVSDLTRMRMSQSAKARCTPEWRKARSEMFLTKIPVEELRRLYLVEIHTMSECASILGVSEKVIKGAMRRNGIKARVPAKRNQKGERNSTWKGDNAGYHAFHVRLWNARGAPKSCSVCGQNDSSKRYEWANLSGRYEDIDDYARMCVSCHRKYDVGSSRKASRFGLKGEPRFYLQVE